mmetsp:Transcript_61459/g.194535  ORF Transcript_61459/g.194535 Transcript_61459/m.194535 type:complete len:329 (-) Transcript_61459:653-1639(-)
MLWGYCSRERATCSVFCARISASRCTLAPTSFSSGLHASSGLPARDSEICSSCRRRPDILSCSSMKYLRSKKSGGKLSLATPSEWNSSSIAPIVPSPGSTPGPRTPPEPALSWDMLSSSSFWRLELPARGKGGGKGRRPKAASVLKCCFLLAPSGRLARGSTRSALGGWLSGFVCDGGGPRPLLGANSPRMPPTPPSRSPPYPGTKPPLMSGVLGVCGPNTPPGRRGRFSSGLSLERMLLRSGAAALCVSAQCLSLCPTSSSISRISSITTSSGARVSLPPCPLPLPPSRPPELLSPARDLEATRSWRMGPYTARHSLALSSTASRSQ